MMSPTDPPSDLVRSLAARGYTLLGEHDGAHVFAGRGAGRLVTVRRDGEDLVVALHAEARYAATWRAEGNEPRAVAHLLDEVDASRFLDAHGHLRRLEVLVAAALGPLGMTRTLAERLSFCESLRFERADAPGRVVVCDTLWDHREQVLDLVVGVASPPAPFPLSAATRADGVDLRLRLSQARTGGAPPFDAWVASLLVRAVEALRGR